MNIILFGFKSCGKTTFGKRLAKHLNWPFLDSDELLEQLYLCRTGIKKTCREIFETRGNEVFRKLESDVTEQLSVARGSVISLGGGMILDPSNAASLAKLGKLVYLKLNKATLKKRILGRTLPAYLDPLDPEGSFEIMYQERSIKYEKILALSVDLEVKTQDQVIQELAELASQEVGVYG